MRSFLRSLALVLTVATPMLATLASSPAHADSYAIYKVGNGNSEAVYGLTNSGTAVLYGLDNCGSGFCYSTFNSSGMLTGTSVNAPGLSFSNGSTCSPVLPAGVTVDSSGTGGRCNGNYAAVEALQGNTRNIYAGQLGSLGVVTSGVIDQLAVNAVGDFLWTDGRNEVNYLAIDLTSRMAPEPSTLALLGTGALGVVGSLRRRLRA